MTTEKAKPLYLLSGGPDTPRERTVGDFAAALAACGTKRPGVAYVGVASGDDKPFFRSLRQGLLDAGAGDVRLAPIVGRHADALAAAEILTRADAVFMSGGEVWDGMAALRDSGLDALLAELYRNGKFFFGVSAGCILMGRRFARWEVEGDDATAGLFPCLDFVPLVFDAHGEYEDWRELRCVVRLSGDGARGYGLATGGFYSADARGRLTSFRNPPAVFVNERGNVKNADGATPSFYY